MTKQILFLALVSITFSSCAALTRYKCNREYAVRKGMEDAAAGLSSQPSRAEGSSCSGEYSPSDYSKDYAYGFQQKKLEICTPTAAAASGRTDGELGQANRPQKGRLVICSDVKDARRIETAYETEFKKAFCAPARATKAGADRAQSWQEPDFETVFSDCGTSAALRRSYMDSYKKALAGACTPAEAERLGTAEATAKRPMTEALSRLDRCGHVGQDSLKGVFELAYRATSDRLAREEAQRQAQEQERIRQQRAAEFHRSVATSSFPFQLRNYISRCAVSPDKSFVQVEVENRYPEQVLIQGNWRVIYYNGEFAKITEDRTLEAVLVTGQNKKAFQKMTLPRDATFCRAEFVGMEI
jgi:hypothetical protein